MPQDAALGRALALVRDLRARCPWDRVQTRETLRPYLVEEALELDDALARGEPAAICDELGDLLLHLAFQVVIGEERRECDAEAVTRALEQKMRRRHPHLFAPGEPPPSWELAKRERGADRRGVLAGLPARLPPLLAAFRMQERAAGVGFDWPDARGPLEKVQEELGELEREIRVENRVALAEEIGDLLFAAVNLARKLAVDPRAALERANTKFARRFEALEELAHARGVELGRVALAELDRLWDEVKRAEPQPGAAP
jgi:nucleoside triphosphate diphosphatase